MSAPNQPSAPNPPSAPSETITPAAPRVLRLMTAMSAVMGSGFLSVVLRVIKKEFIQTFRDRRMLFIILVAPALQVTLFGYAVNLDLASQPTIIVDLDRTPSSRAAAAAIGNDSNFSISANASTYEEAARLITRGDASLAILIPRGFEQGIENNDAEIQVVLDGSDANTATRAGQVASQILNGRAIAVQQLRLAAAVASLGMAPESLTAQVRIESRAWFNPQMRTALFLVPAVLALVLSVITMMLTSMGITREKEIGTLEQIMVTPLRPLELMIGKVTPFALLGLLDVAVIVSVAALVFAVPVRGSLASLFFASALFLMTTLGLGLFISTVSATQQQAMLNAFFVLLPALMLSGYIFPVESMPVAIRYLTYLDPLRYYIELTRGIMVKGATIFDLWRSAALLAALGTLLLVGAAARFHKRVG
jgi:ABC-2 type transport system permease protein